MDLITPAFGLIFWQTLIFLVVLFILGKFAWKPILGALKSREASIEEALKSAEKAKEDAKAIGDKMIEDARATIESERDEALKQIKDQVAELSLQITEKLIRKNLSDDKSQQELIKDYMKDIKLN